MSITGGIDFNDQLELVEKLSKYIVSHKRLKLKKKHMINRTVSKSVMKKERDPEKLKKVLKAKGYSKGKAPRGEEAHRKKPVAEGGKTTQKNIVVIPKEKHQAIHRQNRKRGRI